MADCNDRLMDLESEEKDARSEIYRLLKRFYLDRQLTISKIGGPLGSSHLGEGLTISEIQRLLESSCLGRPLNIPDDPYAQFLKECLQRFRAYLSDIDDYYLSRSECEADTNCYLDDPEFEDESDEGDTLQIVYEDDLNVAQEHTDVSRSYLNDTSPTNQKYLLDKIESAKDLDRIVSILDLTDEHVCKFLPCLLTSFVCSGARKDFFSRSTTGKEEITEPIKDLTKVEEFDREMEKDPRSHRRIAQIKRLCKTLSLKESNLKFKKSVSKRPERYIVNRSKANSDALFATHVFMALSAILFDTAQDMARKAEDTAEAADIAEKAKEVVSKIDLKSCYVLFLDYTDPTSPDLENILSDIIWKYPEYNEILLHNFRFETEHGIF